MTDILLISVISYIKLTDLLKIKLYINQQLNRSLVAALSDIQFIYVQPTVDNHPESTQIAVFLETVFFFSGLHRKYHTAN